MSNRIRAHLWLWLLLGLVATLAGAWGVQARMIEASREDFNGDCDALDESIAREAEWSVREFREAVHHLAGDAAAPQLGPELALGLHHIRALWAVTPEGDAEWLWRTGAPDESGKPSAGVVRDALRLAGAGATPVLSEAHGSKGRVWLVGASAQCPILAEVDLECLLEAFGDRAGAVATGQMWISAADRTLALRVADPEPVTDPVLGEHRELSIFGGKVTVAYRLSGLETAWSRLRPLVTIAVIALGGLVTLLGFFLLCILQSAAERERRLRALSEDLHGRDRDIQRRRDHAEAASAAKSALLRRTSHNMRSPLTTIVGLTDALLARTTPGPSRQQLGAVRASAQHLLDLANELLDIARAESAGIPTTARHIEPDALLREIVAGFAGRAEARGLRLDLRWRGRPPASIHADPTRLREVLINLLDNAVRHTGSGSVTVEACAEPRAGLLTVEIIDTGEGIEPRRLAALAKADDTDASASPGRGTHGMGLAITRHLVNAMGGRLELRSRVGVGTTAIVRIPAAPVRTTGDRAEPQADAQAHPAPACPRRVLVVDDAAEVREFLRVALHEAGAHFDGAASGEEALAAARAGDHGLAIVDQHLGDTDGVSLLAGLRAARPGLPVVALSGDTDPESQRRCLEAGFVAFLPKPFTREQLAQILDYHLADRPGRRAA